VDEDGEYWAQFEAEQNGEEAEEPEDDFNPQDLPSWRLSASER
jgi:GTP-binding protein